MSDEENYDDHEQDENDVRNQEEIIRKKEENLRRQEEKLRARAERRMERAARKREKHFHPGPIPAVPPIPPIPPLGPDLSEFQEQMREFEEQMEEFGQSFEHEFYDHVRKKNITIRGLKSALYNDFSNKMQSHDMNIGMAITKLIYGALKEFNGEFPKLSAELLKPRRKLPKISVRFKEELSLSAHDFEESDSRVEFSHIGTLKFEEDVTEDIFKKYVKFISHCKEVVLPKSIPKLLALSYLNYCESYSFY